MVSAAIIQQFLEQGEETDDDNEVIRAQRSWIQHWSQQQQASR